MAAMKFNGRIVWSPGVIFASAVLAIVASSAAFWIQFRLLSLFPASELLKLLSAFVMAVAVCAVHNSGVVITRRLVANPDNVIVNYAWYIGMAAALFTYDASVTVVTATSVKSDTAFYAALVAALMLAWIIIMVIEQCTYNDRYFHE